MLLLALTFFVYRSQSQVIYNAYASLSRISGTTFTITNVNETNHTFAVNDNIIIMQMQDNVIGTNTTNVTTFGTISPTTNINSAGRWEVAKVSSLTRTSGVLKTMSVASALGNTYNIGTNTSVQIITFRKLSTAAFTSSANITGLTWDGTTGLGGVVALEIGTVFTLGHTISADALGFTGGVKNFVQFASTSCDGTFATAIGDKWAGKGEGIYKNTNANLAGARAKMINGGGGGNDENSGGGGGSNFADGGVGGPGYNGTASGCSPGVGGQGGIPLSQYISGSRIFMGGGGGGGQENNGVGTSGANGGGIVLIKSGTLTTTGSCGTVSITAKGGTAANSGNDASGGGGAGGSIIMQVQTFTIASGCSLNLNASGGSGGTVNDGVAHGAGGGGGQGVVIYSVAQPTTNMSTTVNNGSGGCNNNSVPCNNSASNPTSSPDGTGIKDQTSSPLPIELSSLTAVKSGQSSCIQWTTLTERNNSYFDVERAADGVNFEAIARVNTLANRGNSTSFLKYSYYDNYPLWGINYYRLKQVDIDASFKHTMVVTVYNNEQISEADFTVYPNPSNGDIFMDVRGVDLTNLQIDLTLMDLSGRELSNKTLSGLSENGSQLQLFQGLQKGYYILKVKTGYQNFNIKLMVN